MGVGVSVGACVGAFRCVRARGRVCVCLGAFFFFTNSFSSLSSPKLRAEFLVFSFELVVLSF